MQTIKLKEIASIISGYSFRTSVEEKINTSTYAVQSKNISRNFHVNDHELTNINDGEYNTSAMVNNNDVILSSRGTFKAAVVKSNKKIIATSSVYILRLNDNRVLPEFLAVYLNSKKGQAYLLQSTTGAVINTILKGDLENIPISIPDSNLQKKIVDFYVNNLQLSNLLLQKSQIIGQMSEGIINTL